MNRKQWNGWMSGKILIRAMFVIWIVTITILAVIPHSDDGIMALTNVTSSGIEKHLVGYFIGTLLYYYGFKKNGILFVLISGFLIFLYSVALEAVQYLLPYRTFNVYDIVGNAGGGLLFVVVWLVYSARRSLKKDYSYLTEHTEAQSTEL